MQLIVGLAVRWKSTIQYVRMSVCPESVGNWSSSPQNDFEFAARSIQSCFQLLEGPSCRKSPSTGRKKGLMWRTRTHRQHFFDPTGSNKITISDQIEKNWRKSPSTVRKNGLMWKTHTQSALFRSNWVEYDMITKSRSDRKKRFFRSDRGWFCNPVGSKRKCWRWFPATGPLENRETALDRSWRKLRLILRGGRPTSNIFGQTLMRTYWRYFSTDCKSNCIRIGLKLHPCVWWQTTWNYVVRERFGR